MPPWWTSVRESCLRRIRTWCVPPNCSAQDWDEEMQAQVEAAAWQALHDFDPTRGVPLPAFVRERVLASALTRYRQEWAFAFHCVPEADGAGHESASIEEFPPSLVYESLQQALAWLPEADRALLEQLFWNGNTEAEVAKTLGISQRAVSKRKQAILKRLRGRLEASETNGGEE